MGQGRTRVITMALSNLVFSDHSQYFKIVKDQTKEKKYERYTSRFFIAKNLFLVYLLLGTFKLNDFAAQIWFDFEATLVTVTKQKIQKSNHMTYVTKGRDLSNIKPNPQIFK